MGKKILVVCQHFWPESFRINDICEGFIEQGYEVEVLCGIPNYPKGQYYEGYGIFKNRKQNYNGIKIRRCFEIKRGNNSNLNIFLNYISFPISSIFSLPYLLTQKYDKIFLYQLSPVMMSLAGILLGKLKNIETIMYVLDLWPENLYSVLKIKTKILKTFLSVLCKWHYKNTNKIIANSNKLMTILKTRTKKEENKICYIPQFCEKIYESNIEDMEIKNKYSNGFNLVFTGNISPAQSFETVIKATKIIKEKGINDINWIIVGDGMSKKWLENEIEDNDLKEYFTFIGHVPLTEIPKYTQIADGLFACLSKSDLLDCALPAKVFSYYAAGRPIILAMDGEIQNIIYESKAGYIVNSEDYNGFAQAILKLYQLNKQERIIMGNNAKNYYNNNFERNMNLNKLISFIFN